LSYFDEKTSGTCGECDVCRSRKASSREELLALDRDILSLVREKAQTSNHLIEMLGRERDVVLRELRYLLEEGKIQLTSNNEYIALQ
jgi:ATP-dependent DNA helicase RecQ